MYIPYEGPSLAYQNGRKLGVFDRKLEGNHSIILYLDEYMRKRSHNVKINLSLFSNFVRYQNYSALLKDKN